MINQAMESTWEQICLESENERLDVALARSLGVTRSFSQRLIQDGRVLRAHPEETGVAAAGQPGKLKSSARMPSGTVLYVNLPPVETLEIEPEEVDFSVVYEDRWLLVVDKPAGVVVHPAPGHWRGTLVHGLLHRYPDLGPFNNVRRPGIVHRLDATTSGLMLVAREQRAMELLQGTFKERAVDKRYLALVHKAFDKSSGALEGPIGRHPQNRLRMAVVESGRPSTTEYRVLKNGELALVACKLVTGRTHQIRVHLSSYGHPLFGDFLYGAPAVSGFDRVFLHSWRLSFTHPLTGDFMSFRSSLPPDLLCILKAMPRT